MKHVIAIILASLLTSQLYGIIISNGVSPGTKGYYAVDIGNGGRSINGWIGTGPGSYGDVEFIYEYNPYYSIGGAPALGFTGSPLDLGSNKVQNTGIITGENAPINFTVLSYILTGGRRSYGDVEFIYEYNPYYSIGGAPALGFTGSPLDLGSNKVQNTGIITGENAPINFTVLSYILTGELQLVQTWTFTSQEPFGNCRFIQYLDEDVMGVNDDVLVPLGNYADGTLQLYTIDDASRVGTFQTVDTNDEQNVTWVGWSADRFSYLRSYITGGTVIFLPNGFIETNNLPPIAGTFPQEYGPSDVTTAVAYDLDPAAKQAVLTVVLGGTPEARLAAYAIKILKLKVKDKGTGKSGFSAKMGYNWSGQLPITSVSVVLGDYTNKNIAVTAKGKGFVSPKDPNLKLKVIPKKHTVIIKVKKVNPISLGAPPAVTLGLEGTGDPFDESRDVILSKGKYKENKNLAVPLFYVDKAKIKDSGKTGKDKLKLNATLKGDPAGAGAGLTVKIEGESGTVLQQTIPAAGFASKKGGLKYKRAKGAGTPVKSIKISAKKKTIKISADSFDIPPGAIGAAVDPLITVTVTADLTTLKGGGSLLIRFNQKKPGRLKF